MSAKQLDAKFNKIVDLFAAELSDNDKQRLVAAHELDFCYFKESSIQVMAVLKVTGKFSSRNPEGLLDMADFLGKPDLIEKYSPMIEELKRTKLRKHSSAAFLNHHYNREEAKSALDITRGQVELSRASSGLLKKICTSCKPNMKRTLSEKFEDLVQSLEEAKEKLFEIEQSMAASEPPENFKQPQPESQTTTEFVVNPQQETVNPPPNILQQVANEQRNPDHLAHVLPVRRNTSWGSSTPPGTRRADKPPPPPVSAKPSTPGTERKKTPMMPPTVKARKNAAPDVVLSQTSRVPPPVRPRSKREHTEEENVYDEPHSSPGDRTSGSFTGSFSTTGGSADSGIAGDWPRPQIKQKNEHHYQPLLPQVPEIEMIYEIPT